MAADIISSVPWDCGERDCSVGWHKATYWFDDGADTGYTVDNYSDGDHEEVEQSDLPTPEQEKEAWVEYSHHVADTGADPLEEFNVQVVTVTDQKWKFRFKESSEGIRLVEARHGNQIHKASDLSKLPARIREYLNIDMETGVLRDFLPIGELDPAPYLNRWHTDTIKHEESRPEDVVRQELRAAAQRHLQGEGATKTQQSRKHWDPRERGKP